MPQIELISFIVFQSVIVFQVVYISLQSLYNRKKEYYYYLGYMLCVGLYAVLKYEAILGYKFWGIIDANAEAHFDRALALFAYFLYYRFARYFIGIEKLLPKLNTSIKKMETFVLVYVAFELAWEFLGLDRRTSEYIFWAVSAFLFVTTVYFGVLLFRKKNPLVSFVIFGAIMVNLGSALTILLLNLQTVGICTSYDPYIPLHLCVVVEILAFTTGLAYKSKLIERETLIAQNALIEQVQKNLLLSERVNETRSAIASDFHDDLCASLSSISIYSSLMQKAMKENPNQLENLIDKISGSAARLTDSMLDIVWALNPSTQRMRDIINRIRSFTKDEVQPLGYQVSIQDNPLLENEKLNAEAIKNIFVVTKAFIRHCCKYSEANVISLKFIDEQDNLVLNVQATAKLSAPDVAKIDLKRYIITHAEKTNGKLISSDTDIDNLSLVVAFPLTSIRD